MHSSLFAPATNGPFFLNDLRISPDIVGLSQLNNNVSPVWYSNFSQVRSDDIHPMAIGDNDNSMPIPLGDRLAYAGAYRALDQKLRLPARRRRSVPDHFWARFQFPPNEREDDDVDFINQSHQRDAQGNTLLMKVAGSETTQSYLWLKQLLVDGRADPNVKNRHGDTALHFAIATGDVENALLLVDNGADINVQGWQGQTPLHLATLKDDKDLVSELLLRGADYQAVDIEGNTSLHMAVIYDRKTTFYLLRRLKPILNIRNREGNTPLTQALKDRFFRFAFKLIDAGTNLTLRDQERHTPLMLAVLADRHILVEKLINKLDNINAMDQDGNNALHLAVKFGKRRALKVLVRYHPVFEIGNNEGMTPLMLAHRLGNRSAAKILMYYGARALAEDNTGGKTASRAIVIAAGEAQTTPVPDPAPVVAETFAGRWLQGFKKLFGING
ncbi:hypothetical protein FCN80_01665 [Martelella alba]|uniref:Ankyrin repeat protein n=2 Tax=Martelella alba TaxID=2590451 RepID=A0ABY2SSC7_9HYPH|nr:hypothetical protein FCN80_01665 [Martelella alba]